MFKDIDPVVVQAARKVFDTHRANNLRAKHQRQEQQKIETQVQLLVDEVSQVIPLTHPSFLAVLMLAASKKFDKQEPEYKSALEFPEDF